MRARYADGRSAVFRDIEAELDADELIFRTDAGEQRWLYAELARADDGNGRIVLRRKKNDAGERVEFDAEADPVLKAVAPHLFKPAAHGVEGARTLGAVTVFAWSLAAVFLLGIPMMAEPIASNMPTKYRDQIADISWSQVNQMTAQCDDSDQAAQILNALAYRMMETSNVAGRDDIWITIADAPFPNAFALPDDSIIVTDDLIAMAEHPDEVTGVLAHEIAHIEHNHVMKNVVRQMGAGIFFDIVFGGAGAGQAVAILSLNLSSLSFTRGDEEDADDRGMDYLEAAGIDTIGIAHMFDRIEEFAREQGAGDIPTLLSSHPASAARAEAARARGGRGAGPSMTPGEWRVVQQACGGVADSETDVDPPSPTPSEAPVPAPQAPDPAATKPTTRDAANGPQ